jgi:hypothetical protein
MMTQQTASRETLMSRLLEYSEDNDRLLDLLERCETVLGNMAKENVGWRRFLWRWQISDEPLRNDAKNLLPLIEAALTCPDGEKADK